VFGYFLSWLFGFEKFILLPIGRVINDVIGYVFKRFIVADDVVVKTGLPRKIGIYFSGGNGNR
jgi:hypothetical protein